MLEPTDQRGSRLGIGDRVRIAQQPPDLADGPKETLAAFRYALGRVYTIRGFGRYGHVELALGRKADRVLGSYGNSIWVEPACLRLQRRRS